MEAEKYRNIEEMISLWNQYIQEQNSPEYSVNSKEFMKTAKISGSLNVDAGGFYNIMRKYFKLKRLSLAKYDILMEDVLKQLSPTT